MLLRKRGFTSVRSVLAALALLGALVVAAPPALAQGGAVIDDTDCLTNVLPANDDGSTDLVDLPFAANFFGTSYGGVYINNNGNVTFLGPLSAFTPFDLLSTEVPIIAPFFADVDTRDPASGEVTYGSATFDGRPALCVNWVGVGYYNQNVDKLNSFQLLLVDRSADFGPGDFDIIFNYDTIQWETGDASDGTGGLGGDSARAGFSSGFGGAPTGTTSFQGVVDPGDGVSLELEGSAVNGALLDGGPNELIGGSNGSVVQGRYVFGVRNGSAPTGGDVRGTVTGPDGNPLGGAFVQVCGDVCFNSLTNASGQYAVQGVDPGTYDVRVNPPSGSDLNSGRGGPGVLDPDGELVIDVMLTGPVPPPPGTGIEPSVGSDNGLPVIYWNATTTLTGLGCEGASNPRYEIRQGPLDVNGLPAELIQGGGMTEGPAGVYTAIVPPVFPNHGLATVVILIDGCPDPLDDTTTTFDIYIDPSGNVVDTDDNPIEGATVTLYRSDSESGPFTVVPDGSAIMSPSNRDNPDTTLADGSFRWDVIAGYYFVRAEFAGCGDPVTGDPFVDTEILEIPPPALDLVLVMDCEGQPPVETCFGLPATGPATEGDDVLIGTPGDDEIDGLGGNDLICGLGGDDTLRGGAGTDTIDGGPGADLVDGGDDKDDGLFGGPGDDVVLGGDGDDRELRGQAGNDVVNGGAGNDRLLLGNDGNDTIYGGPGDDVNLRGGMGVDTIIGGSGHDTIDGGPGDDARLLGGPGNDVVLGGPGNDVEIRGQGGNDLVDGGFGNDLRVLGNAGDDQVLGGDGDDRLNGGQGNDYVDGGPGTDLVRGGPGTDTCLGETQIDCEL